LAGKIIGKLDEKKTKFIANFKVEFSEKVFRKFKPGKFKRIAKRLNWLNQNPLETSVQEDMMLNVFEKRQLKTSGIVDWGLTAKEKEQQLDAVS